MLYVLGSGDKKEIKACKLLKSRKFCFWFIIWKWRFSSQFPRKWQPPPCRARFLEPLPVFHRFRHSVILSTCIGWMRKRYSHRTTWWTWILRKRFNARNCFAFKMFGKGLDCSKSGKHFGQLCGGDRTRSGWNYARHSAGGVQASRRHRNR